LNTSTPVAYQSFANMFELIVNKGTIFGSLASPENSEDPESVSFRGKNYSLAGVMIDIVADPAQEIVKRFIFKNLISKLAVKGFSRRRRRISYVVFRRSDEVQHPHTQFFRIYNGFEIKVRTVEEAYLLCIDPHVVIESEATLAQYVQQGLPLLGLSGFSVKYDTDTYMGIDGYLIETLQNGIVKCRIKNYRSPDETLVDVNRVKPEPRPEVLQELGDKIGIDFDVIKLQRKLSLQGSPIPSRHRFEKTKELARLLAQEIFPLKFGNFTVEINASPVAIVI